MRCKRRIISYKKHLTELERLNDIAYKRGFEQGRLKGLAEERSQYQSLFMSNRKETITRVLDSIAQSLTAVSHVVSEIGSLEQK